MKSIPVIQNFLTNPQRRRSLLILARLVGMFSLLVLMQELSHCARGVPRSASLI
jgi:hypothetical protein